jgi:hypothetical protein
MVENPPGLIGKIRQHLEKVLIAASGLVILVGGYFTWDYRSYTECQTKVNDSVVQAIDANQQTMTTFREALTVLLTQPPRPPEERLAAFQRLQEALNRQEALMSTIPRVPSEGCR